jgi:hypothetical protein
MDLQSYIDTNSKKKPNSDIAQRWQTRVITQGLQNQGQAGAQQYLNLYGKGIAAPKCIMFAVYAQQAGFPEFALGMWKKAFQLETGQVPGTVVVSDSGNPVHVPTMSPPIPPAVVLPKSYYFPPSLQPGKLVTMQPEDAIHPRAQYLERDEYWGQPKRDGNKVVIFAAPDGVWYQSRSMKLRGDPDLTMTRVLRTYAEQRNKGFILEGELYFLDYAGMEHRTGAQAAKVNIEAGKGEIPVLTRYMPFYAVYDDSDLRDDTYAVRILHGNAIANDLAEMTPIFVVPQTARTYEEKSTLATLQFIEGREGEVWFRASARYHAGKDKSEDVVRTKYLMEFDARVIGLTSTTAQGRLFGAIAIADIQTGKLLGNVGTGFDRATQEVILARHNANPGNLIIPVVSQGLTEDGFAWHARLSEDFM